MTSDQTDDAAVTPDPADEAALPPELTISGRGASGVGVAAVVAAAASYGVLVVVARTVGVAENSTFLVFWSLLFLLFGALLGVYTETTRAVRAASLGGDAGAGGARVLWSALLVGLVAGAVLVASAWAWAPHLLGDDALALTAVLAAAVLLFTGHSALGGALSGRHEWGLYAGLVSGEALVRLAAVGAVAALGGRLLGLETAVVAGSLVWLVLLVVSPRSRTAARARADVPLRRLLGNTGHAILAAAASAALVVGFPVLLRATSDAGEWTTAAPLVLAISLTRAPLLIPLTAYQGVAVTYFLVNRRRGFAPALRLAGGITLVGVAGSVLAAFVGPFLLALLFGPAYRLAGGTLAGLTIAATVLALLTLSGSAVLALGLHAQYSRGWLLATAVAVALLLLPLSLSDRAVVSLVVGPVAGLLYHGRVLARSS